MENLDYQKAKLSLRTYLIYAALGLMTTSALTFAAVAQFNQNDPLTADGLNAIVNELNAVSSGMRKVYVATGDASMQTLSSGSIDLPGRVMHVNKALDETTLRITYTNNFGVGGRYGGCSWDITQNGQPCPADTFTAARFSFIHGTGNSNLADIATMIGYCKVPAGGYNIAIKMTATNGVPDCMDGWAGGKWSMEIEEVLASTAPPL